METIFDNEECMAILDVIDRVFEIPKVLFKGIFDTRSGLSVDYSRRLESYCRDAKERKVVRKLIKGGRFYNPKKKGKVKI